MPSSTVSWRLLNASEIQMKFHETPEQTASPLPADTKPAASKHKRRGTRQIMSLRRTPAKFRFRPKKAQSIPSFRRVAALAQLAGTRYRLQGPSRPSIRKAAPQER